MLSVVAIAAPLLGLAVVPSAAADTVSSTQAQASALASRIRAGADHLHALDVAYQSAQQQSALANQKSADAQSQIETANAQITSDRAALGHDAVEEYMRGGTISGLGALVRGKSDQVYLRAAYINLASGNLADVVDNLKLSQAQLHRALLSSQMAQTQAREGLTRAAQARSGAQAQVISEESLLSGLKGQLASLVAQAQADQASRGRNNPPPQGQPLPGGLSSVAVSSSPSYTSAGGPYAGIRQCESGDNYAADTGNGYYGAYQISADTWHSLGYSGYPDDASPPTQDQAAERLQARSGWGQWPTCSAAMGLN